MSHTACGTCGDRAGHGPVAAVHCALDATLKADLAEQALRVLELGWRPG